MPQVDITIIASIVQDLFFLFFFSYILFIFLLLPLVSQTKLLLKYTKFSLVLKKSIIIKLKKSGNFIFLKNLKI